MNQNPTAESQHPDDQTVIEILLEEYRQLYALGILRLTSLDQHIPLAAGALTAMLGAIGALSSPLQTVLLIGLPLSLSWLVRVTVNHARSFEDALRRIEEIEKTVNACVGMSLLVFQSSHPSRNLAIGGRTGMVTVEAVLGTAALLAGGSLYICAVVGLFSDGWLAAYAAFVAVIAADLLRVRFALAKYRYRKRVGGDVPIS